MAAPLAALVISLLLPTASASAADADAPVTAPEDAVTAAAPEEVSGDAVTAAAPEELSGDVDTAATEDALADADIVATEDASRDADTVATEEAPVAGEPTVAPDASPSLEPVAPDEPAPPPAPTEAGDLVSEPHEREISVDQSTHAGSTADHPPVAAPPPSALAPALPQTLPPVPIAPARVQTKPRFLARGPAREKQLEHAAAAAIRWARPVVLVPQPAPQAADLPLQSSWLSTTVEENRQATSAREASETSTGHARLRSPPPRVPHAPSSGVCVAAGACAAVSLGMLPLLAALGCLCALVFERLFEASTLWRPERFLRPRERPG